MLNTTATNGRKTAKKAGAKVDIQKYGKLLLEHYPAIIETEKENRRVLKIIETLMRKGKERTPEETSLLRLLAHLSQDFDRRFYEIPTAEPREILRELMNGNRLKQADLAPIFGTKSVISEVLSGKRQITKAQAKALGERFNISAKAFL